ncbi:MAG: HEPN domain-containing protein [Lachnospiraceae bacterium]|nr:HEPN domain-containing protein [Lachnospiraceae bacterium]
MDSKEKDLYQYRIASALETLETAKWCVSNRHYKDAINRCYYAAFYAAKAVLALEAVDFKRHKDVVSYFNKHYIATGKLPKEVGKKLAHLQRKRENSDYDDFFIASLEETEKQLESAEYIIEAIQKYLV